MTGVINYKKDCFNFAQGYSPKKWVGVCGQLPKYEQNLQFSLPYL